MLSIKPIVTGSDGNLYIINSNDNLYLLECGIKYKDIIRYLHTQNLLISQFKGCFITHKHSDHAYAIRDISKYMSIYTNRQVKEMLYYGDLILNPKKAYFFEGNLCVMPFNVEHGSAECYAYMFKNDDYKILFITDCFKFEEPLKAKFDEIYIECNWTSELMLEALEKTKDTPEYTKFERQFQTHLSLDNLKLILERSLDLTNCKRMVLVHASKEVCDKDLALKELKSLYPNIDISFAENEF